MPGVAAPEFGMADASVFGGDPCQFDGIGAMVVRARNLRVDTDVWGGCGLVLAMCALVVHVQRGMDAVTSTSVRCRKAAWSMQICPATRQAVRPGDGPGARRSSAPGNACSRDGGSEGRARRRGVGGLPSGSGCPLPHVQWTTMLPFRAGRTTLCWLRADPAAGRPTVLDDDSGCWGMHGADGSGHLPPPPADAEPAAGYLARFVPIRCSAVFGCRVPRETCGWVVFQDATRVAGGMHGEDGPGLPRPAVRRRRACGASGFRARVVRRHARAVVGCCVPGVEPAAAWLPRQDDESKCRRHARRRRGRASCHQRLPMPSLRRFRLPGQVRSMRCRRCAGPQGST